MLPKAEKMLDIFEKRLTNILSITGPIFSFESAHIGHCVRVSDGFRFFNWEKNVYGDPSYSLAVFLASVIEYPNFTDMKEQMIHAYVEEKTIPELRELVDQRLAEREVSNLIWSLWAHVKSNEAGIGMNIMNPTERFTRVAELLKEY